MPRCLPLPTEVDHLQRCADADKRGRQHAVDAYNRFINAVASRGAHPGGTGTGVFRVGTDHHRRPFPPCDRLSLR